MEEQDDLLGTLFKTSFEGHKAPLEEGEWAMLSNSLGKRNFFKFNLYQFNIYYASTIIACFFICLGVGIHYVYKQYAQSDPIAEVLPLIQQSNSAASITIKRKSEEIKNSPDEVRSAARLTRKMEVEHIAEKETALKVHQQEPTSSSTPKDTLVSNAPYKAAPQPALDSSKNNKKVLYITKQDTIFKYDTVRTQKPRKRWLK